MTPRSPAVRAIFSSLALTLFVTACDAPAPPPPAPTASAKPAKPSVPEAAGVRYSMRLTGGATEGEELPLVIAIHGLGSSPDDLVGLYAQIGVKARLVLPYGFDPYLQGFTWFEPGSLADPDKLANGSMRAAARLSAMIEDVSRGFPTRGKAVVSGFSQGAILSYSLAVLHPDRVRAAFPVSGILPAKLVSNGLPAGKELPVIRAFHGTSDERISVDGDRGSVRRLKELGGVADISEYPGVGHTITSDMRRDIRRAIEDALRQ